ncbi:hypothetical protein OTERR_19310 [Oryzomicrobium terrae]|uniref:diguanylate cyclase n=1 Tax=Oryzomicrobium terrae TaxID=1735038 RepID=A0A5C1EB35_9RHOO|nr:diguanylate cyclase [Oryzomicrobium terrae]QEL65407.1 hypothetical protein OTERR_19310 [Oryzomicrobium terrae]
MNDAVQPPKVLIVDDSRIVRASLMRHLKGRFEVREEGDGETGWQTLVLDPTIQAVISDLSMPVLDGYGLLERIRQSKIGRIRRLPVIMISGEDDDDACNRARAAGASDFISKGVGTAELLTRLDAQIRLATAEEALDAVRDDAMKNPLTGLFTRRYLESQADQACSLAQRKGGEVSLLMIGFDRLPALTEQYGAAVVEQLVAQFGRLLAGKIRREDSLGHYGSAQFAIVSPGTPGASCRTFALRLKEAVETAHVAFHGQRVDLSVSIGVANNNDDQSTSANHLLILAGERMGEAMAGGGNRVVGCEAEGRRPDALTVDRALALLEAGRGDMVRGGSRELALRVLPLLRFLNYELQWQLPVEDLERQLNQSHPRDSAA